MKKVFSLLAPYMGRHKFKMIFYVIFTTLLGVCSILSPVINGHFVDLLLSSSTLHILYIYIVFTAIYTLVNIGVASGSISSILQHDIINAYICVNDRGILTSYYSLCTIQLTDKLNDWR